MSTSATRVGLWIAGKRSDADWSKLKARLDANPNAALWGRAFDQFHMTRIRTRYLSPMSSIAKHDRERGEGFALVALFCTLVEFLESTEQGTNYRYIGRNDPPRQPDEYDQYQASDYFRHFLTRPPFDNLVAGYADSFYRHVRCGLLHEARTKGGWRISSNESRVLIAEDRTTNPTTKTLYRKRLIPALRQYLKDYRLRLLVDAATQRAFIKKWEFLSQP